MFEPTQAPNRDRENARPPHCSCIAYLHSIFAVWQRLHVGLCSSHFWRRALHLVQPVKDLDMGAGCVGKVLRREEFLRGKSAISGFPANDLTRVRRFKLGLRDLIDC